MLILHVVGARPNFMKVAPVRAALAARNGIRQVLVHTERPVTVSLGTNILVGRDMDRLKAEARNILSGKSKCGKVPPLWDGKAGERIAEAIVNSEARTLKL